MYSLIVPFMIDKRSLTSARNGAKSTGAKTPAGLLRCFEAARRPRRPGLTTLLPGESPDAFEAFRAEIRAYWRPVNEVELELVDNLSVSLWIIQREIHIGASPGFDFLGRSIYHRAVRAHIRNRSRLIARLCDLKKLTRRLPLLLKTNHLPQNQGPRIRTLQDPLQGQPDLPETDRPAKPTDL